MGKMSFLLQSRVPCASLRPHSLETAVRAHWVLFLPAGSMGGLGWGEAQLRPQGLTRKSRPTCHCRGVPTKSLLLTEPRFPIWRQERAADGLLAPCMRPP